MVARVLTWKIIGSRERKLTDGFLKLVADKDGQKVLGVQIIGHGATELIHVGQMALMAGYDVEAGSHSAPASPRRKKRNHRPTVATAHRR